MAANKFIGMLFNSRTQAHVFHLVTPYYSQHKALEKYYEKIVDLTDSYAEAYMGQYGRLKKINANSRFLRDPKKARLYFMNLLKRIKHLRLPKDTYLRNIQDEITALIRRTIYMLTLR
jgi:DNA-binding ferritin-like protein